MNLHHFQKKSGGARCTARDNRDNFVVVPSYVELPWLHGSLPHKSTASVSFWLYMFCKIRWTRVWITAVGS